ncbi:23S rRNA (guanosine(2251)-2'-O)-methyltransferase RlmB [Pyruvatibacter sp. HU-CL02332]|uniref:23S rRNA (guanosine(2251)-2'-O)-methyltransferase RlmB n=1 Tax=Pyruvatibacter sp. HU-CL02332 TaxID=3127650 RepID=UPI0033653F52
MSDDRNSGPKRPASGRSGRGGNAGGDRNRSNRRGSGPQKAGPQRSGAKRTGGKGGDSRGNAGNSGRQHAGRPRQASQQIVDGPDWLYGAHAVRAALMNPKRRLLRLIATENGSETIAEPARQRGLQIEKADGKDMDRMFAPGTVHQGIALRVAPLPDPVLADILGASNAADENGEPTKPLVILDQVTDPQNVGAVLRSAAVFGARAVIVTRRNSPPITGTLAKAASGAVEQMPLVQVPNVAQAIAVLQSEGWFTVGLEGTGDKSLAQMDLTGKIAIVMGAEGTGLRRLTAERCDLLAKIPGEPGFASLNVSNATAVALYEISRQRG